MPFIVFLLWISPTSADYHCEVYRHTFECFNATHDEFLDEIFRNERDIKNKVTTIHISHANYSTIEEFPCPPPLRKTSGTIKTLGLIETNIEKINGNAFVEWEILEDVILRRNKISDISFVKNLPRSVSSLDLSYNDVTVLDLEGLHEVRKLIIRNNKIEMINRSTRTINMWTLDFSHNKLTNYDENYLNCYSDSLDLSYNKLTHVFLNGGKSSVNLVGNDILSLGAYEKKAFSSRTLYLTNFPSNTKLQIENAFIMTGSNITRLDKQTFDMNRLYTQFYKRPILDFSNSSISFISKLYFAEIYLSEINLSYNNLTVLEGPFFKNSYVNKINLAFSGIRFLYNTTFEGLYSCDEIILRGNFLNVVENICSKSKFTRLDLSFNKIRQLEVETLYNCLTLESLNISYNSIEIIEPGIFQTLSQLRILDLSRNDINLDKDFLSNLKNIFEINLSHNNIHAIECNSFFRLSVYYLKLSHNPVKIIKTQAFNDLYIVEVLNLTGLGIEEIESKAFFNLSSINTIDLSNNKLSTLVSYSFSNLPLKILLLHGNKLKLIQSRAFDSLNSIHDLDLRGLYIEKIAPHAFSNLTNAKSIDLRYNNISSIGGYIFDKVEVGRIYLNGNNITVLSPIRSNIKVKELILQFSGDIEKQAISNMYLEKLYMIDSNINIIKNKSFQGTYNLKELHFNRSKIISYEPEILKSLYNLKYLDAHNLFKNERKVYQNMFNDTKSMKILNLSNLNLTEIDSNDFTGLNELKSICLRSNGIEKINRNTFDRVKLLQHLDLSFNQISTIDLNFMEKLLHMKSLYLNNNQIENLTNISDDRYSYFNLTELYLNDNLIRTIEPNLFSKFRNLEILDLQNNLIKEISLNTFDKLDALKRLLLRHNRLEYHLETGVFNGSKNLTMLDLSHNNIISMISKINIATILTLTKLEYLNVENTGLNNNFEYSLITTYMKHLKQIEINYNDFSCRHLLIMLKVFDDFQINYTPLNPNFETTNINGIICSMF